MIGSGIFTVFALGLRHGADPDHLAAIDNLTRNAIDKRPFLSRFVGTIFATGHSLMVLAIAALVGLLGVKFSAHHEQIETFGTWVSIGVLVVIGLMNLQQLSANTDTAFTGLKTRLLPQSLRQANHPLVAFSVGLFFGVGFETSSQIATYVLAFGAEAGMIGALVIGGFFSLGMIVTDTLDSVLVYRLVEHRRTHTQANVHVVRVWIMTVTAMALFVAAYESAQAFGWHSPFPDIALSACMIVILGIVFAYIVVATRRQKLVACVPVIPSEIAFKLMKG